MKRLIASVIVATLFLNGGAAFAAGPLETAGIRAVAHMSDSQGPKLSSTAQTAGKASNRKTILWTGAALSGVGAGLLAYGAPSSCSVTMSGAFVTESECGSRSVGAAAAGFLLLATGGVVLIIGALK